MFAVLVTDPVGPSVPWVLTSIWPEEKIVAGPESARADAALAVWGLFEASDASVTASTRPVARPLTRSRAREARGGSAAARSGGAHR